MASNDWPWVISDEDQWTTSGDGFQEIINEFYCPADITTGIVSDGRQTRNFSSQADIASSISDPVFGREYNFASTADVQTSIPNIDAGQERNFASTADIVSDASSALIPQHNFRIDRTITFSAGSTIFAYKDFASQADIVTSITDPIWFQGGVFSVTAGIASGARSDIKANNLFTSQADIVFDANGPTIFQENRFLAQSDIIFNTESSFGGARWFAVSSTISWVANAPHLNRTVKFACEPGIVHSITSDANAVREFSSQADISTDVASDANAERHFDSIAEDIVFDVQRPAFFKECQFRSVPLIRHNITSDARARRVFSSTDGPTFDIVSAGGSAEREFASQPTLSLSIISDANTEREFASQSDIITDSISAINRKRSFASTSAITFDLTSIIRRFLGFSVAPSIEFVTNNVNIFKTNYFGILPEINIEISDPGIFIERHFETESDITFSVDSEIKTTRNFASTVNITVNVKSLNIWNLELDDLFPATVRSLTPKQTANLI